MDLSTKTLLRISSWILSTSLALVSFEATASDVVYVPGFCEPSEMTLKIANSSREPQRIWTQVRFDEILKEEFHDVLPEATLTLKGEEFLLERSGFSLKTWSKKNLSFQTRCQQGPWIPLTSTTSPEVTHWLPGSSGLQLKLHLLNLYPLRNKVTVKAYDAFHNELESRDIVLEKNYVTDTSLWKFSKNISALEVVGQERLHSWLVYSGSEGVEKVSPALVMSPKRLSPPMDQTYFLISTKESRPEESFVIALTDKEKIEIARQQIRDKNLEKIIVAGIQMGNNNVNRSFSAKDKSPYSWFVHRVDAFADFAHIDCDGSPDQTEERLIQKLSDGGRICFWRYRVIRELTPEEVASGKLNSAISPQKKRPGREFLRRSRAL